METQKRVLDSEIREDSHSSAGQQYDEFIYFGHTKDQGAYDIAVGHARIEHTQSLRHEAGDRYFMLSDPMHRVVCTGKDMTSTLTCHAAPARRWARMLDADAASGSGTAAGLRRVGE